IKSKKPRDLGRSQGSGDPSSWLYGTYDLPGEEGLSSRPRASRFLYDIVERPETRASTLPCRELSVKRDHKFAAFRFCCGLWIGRIRRNARLGCNDGYRTRNTAYLLPLAYNRGYEPGNQQVPDVWTAIDCLAPKCLSCGELFRIPDRTPEPLSTP